MAELAMFEWVIVSPGQKTGITNMLYQKTSLHDYEKRSSLDCLGVEGRRDNSNNVYEEFEKQLGGGPGGFYKTNLIWRDNHPSLENNKSNNIGLITSLMTNLTHKNQLERYHNIIQDQKEGIEEKVDEVW